MLRPCMGMLVGCLLANLVTLVAVPVAAQPAASDYPSRPIVVHVPQAVGGSTDVLSRTILRKLSEVLGQSIVVENRAGANGIIGTELVAKAPPNGYTLLVGGTGTMAINPGLYTKLPYDPVRQFTPVAMFGYSTSVLIVHPSVRAGTIGELIALAKSKPGELKYASAGIGSSPHLSAEIFKQLAGIELLHVPYKGSTPGVSATIAGEIDLMFTGIASALAQIKSGRLRALSINGARRSPALPNVPIAAESGLPGFDVDFWIGLFAPAGTPRTIVTRLNAEINAIASAAEIKELFLVLGVDALPLSPEQYAELLAKDTERWIKAVRSAGIKGE